MGAGYSYEEKDIKAVPGQIVQLPETTKHDIQYQLNVSIPGQVFVLPYLPEPGNFEVCLTAKASDVIVKLGPFWVDHNPPFFNSEDEFNLPQNHSLLIYGRVIETRLTGKIYINEMYLLSPTGASDAAPPQ